MFLKKLKNSYSRLIYWGSISQSLIRSPVDAGYYVLSYPKSGSNWLSNMLSSYFDIPVLESWNECWPVTDRRIYHLHRILPFRSMDRRTVYVVRDGRDVIVSYFYEMVRSPYASSIRNKFSRYIGRPVTEADINLVMSDFVDFLYKYRRASIRYDKHLMHALSRSYIFVKFESLRNNTSLELSRIVNELTGQCADVDKINTAVELNSISRVRTVENAHFVRNGETGNWKTHFNREAAEKFWAYYGEVMMRAGYELGDEWIGSVPQEVGHL